MRWSAKDERRLLDSINGDAKPTNWRLLFWATIGVILCLSVLIVRT